MTAANNQESQTATPTFGKRKAKLPQQNMAVYPAEETTIRRFVSVCPFEETYAKRFIGK